MLDNEILIYNMQDLTWYIDKVLIRDLKDFEHNPRRMSKADFDRLVRDLQQDGYHNRILVNQDNTIIGGHSRKKAMLKAGFKSHDIIEVLKPSRQLTEEEFKRINVRDNLPFGDFDFDILANAFEVDDLIEWGMPAEWLGKDMETEEEARSGRIGNFFRNFLVPPFSVLNTREGYWQERKKNWTALGIQSEIGRKEGALGGGMGKTGALWAKVDGANVSKVLARGTSIFDPVLAELSYLWFSPLEGTILDPFAGGSVRGVVAGALGRNYVGIDLRTEQIEENIKQWEEIKQNNDFQSSVIWKAGDSRNIKNLVGPDFKADLIFSCPPYADLEVYSDDPQDLSTMPYENFRRDYSFIIKESCTLLKENAFACFVVGEVRGKKGGDITIL